MTVSFRTAAWAAPVLAAGLLVASAGSAVAATTTLTSDAVAANETPTPGPPGATAKATFTIDTSSGQICYLATASGLTTLAAAHIHRGATGVAGPVVVPLDASKINSGQQTCTNAAPALAAEIAGNPTGFYFNVHTPEFSAGAVRGQLALAPAGVAAGSGGGASTSGRDGLLVLTVLLVGGVLTVGSVRRLARR